MGLVDKLRTVFGSGSQSGVRYDCAGCGKTFDEHHANCLHCGSIEIEEKDDSGIRSKL